MNPVRECSGTQPGETYEPPIASEKQNGVYVPTRAKVPEWRTIRRELRQLEEVAFTANQDLTI